MDKQQTNQKQSNSFLNQFIWWKLDPIQLKKQVSEYTSLKIYKSYRGIAVLLIAGWIFLTKFFSLVQWIPNNKFIVSLFIYEDIGFFNLLFYLFLIVFIYKGKKWAIIVAMMIQTLNSGYALLNSITSVNMDIIFWLMIIFWWSLFMRFLYGAYRVEKERNKIKKEDQKVKEVKFPQNEEVKKSLLRWIIVCIFLIITSISGLFYWFQFRPTEIRSYCHTQAKEKATLTTKKSTLLDTYYPSEKSENKISTEDYDVYYTRCLRDEGL